MGEEDQLYFDVKVEDEDGLVEQLAEIQTERSLETLEEAAEFVVGWCEMFDPYFVNYCEALLSR